MAVIDQDDLTRVLHHRDLYVCQDAFHHGNPERAENENDQGRARNRKVRGVHTDRLDVTPLADAALPPYHVGDGRVMQLLGELDADDLGETVVEREEKEAA